MSFFQDIANFSRFLAILFRSFSFLDPIDFYEFALIYGA
jgi:hypothetical protein